MQPDPQLAESPAFARRHYTVAELARLWHLSDDLVRKLFRGERDVICIGVDRSTGRKRRYVSMRVPADVAERIYRRLQTSADAHRGRRP